MKKPCSLCSQFYLLYCPTFLQKKQILLLGSENVFQTNKIKWKMCSTHLKIFPQSKNDQVLNGMRNFSGTISPRPGLPGKGSFSIRHFVLPSSIHSAPALFPPSFPNLQEAFVKLQASLKHSILTVLVTQGTRNLSRFFMFQSPQTNCSTLITATHKIEWTLHLGAKP